MEKSVALQFASLSELTGKVIKLEDTRLYAKHFWKNEKVVAANLETVRKATADNFNTQLATDNYIEKYLPFAMQEQISENILSCLSRPLHHN